MAGPIRIYNDIQNRKLVVSNADGTNTSFPTLVQGEQPVLNLFFMEPADAGLTDPFDFVNFTGATIKLGIIAGAPTGGPDTLIAYQPTWAQITNGWQARLDCNTLGISNALNGNDDVGCTVEIEVTESGGYPVKYFQGGCTIKSAVIDSNSVGSVTLSIPLSLAEGDARYAKKIGLAGETITLVSPDGTKAVLLGCNDDGTFRTDLINPYTA